MKSLHRFKRWLFCWLFNHKIYVVQVFSRGYRKIACERCKKVWAMSDQHRSVLPWDQEMEDLYRALGHKSIKSWR